MKENLLENIIIEIIAKSPQTKAQFDSARRQVAGKLKMKQPSNPDLLKAYQKMLKNKRVKKDKRIELFLRKADIRTLSGIAIVTSLVKPYACPGKCVYCPTETRMPKSYIASEPAAARALGLKFDPYVQMQKRIQMLEANGHPTEKIEYIIKGGTWNSYPLKYQYWFILESFRACNELASKHLNIQTFKHTINQNSPLEELQKAVAKEQKKNEKAKYRIIGLTLETRPDAITPKTIFHMRQQGCTRIELGLQAPDDEILELVKRGHTVQQFRDAMLLLRQAGFKVDLHFMPDLPGTTPKHDVEMYASLFTDIGLCPDMVKIYPNTVIASAELYEWFKDGRYTPYGENELFEALIQMKLTTPRYCRISRLIRDIPSEEITAGNSITNLRESLKKEILKKGKDCVCLRCREISRQFKNLPADAKPQLFIDTYETIGGTEYFITFEDKDRIAVYAFLRLRIPTIKAPKELYELIPEIKNTAFVRELHTYGQLLEIGKSDKKASQHKGMGKKLLLEAEKIAKKNKFKKISVISGVGVKGYYKKVGYSKKGSYMVKSI
ncbi:MAG: hypothetical protein A2725_03655 [Candidatus Magasanikbacteria bacterium RIFCSPHIGHO2_01_FULL_33_34]|uniref:tRNA carboxymethyluridine synthase n=1 Tax=Candidatus Magasanikbacteria bacterium RIFCSPHIGHO2_01_FULL_33_34 TaxID=1798671 RepID=A0A1F6LHL7_9BACT|nr:MAG: hypothetical protein A2725_03655 [Candidatus Magasanikbacteria bacterium RIFCSPHIGHO2_01_FULL_33_34]OGH65067.1 MAG: hypothetical protein A3B83_03415 [Candidatus Magasanikbacteria bacterium RIFCSPHIGHO2_02_FULL_33_17]OGH75389.1 MAG: hypothetical protein A3A89_04750 [Candidatus Magasanikbacteria bacterium RIFCSPLOWO2_01_FULL_33_34]